MKKLSEYFLQGLLYLAPITITIYIVYLIFDFTDNLLTEELYDFIGFRIPGLGVIIILMALTALGFIGQTIIARPFKYVLHLVIRNIPFLQLIYSAVKDFFSAFVGKDRKFNKPVLVEMPPDRTFFRIGFLTHENMGAMNLKDMVTVYFPFSYTFTGEIMLVPRSHIKPIEMPPSEVLKFVVAGGVADLDNHSESQD
jgi:uncharacterized membrane protein